MSNKNLTCKTGLKKDIISKTVFNREIEMCKKLSKENKGRCGWGKCKDCGVLFLLYKFYKGELIEDRDDIKKIRRSILEI